MKTARLEAFSDGVFAIAITLLVLNIAVPDPGHLGSDGLGGALRDQWPSYVAFAVSFVTIGIIWVNHHAVFDQVAQVDRTLLFLNLLLLASVAVIPFPTALLSRAFQAGAGQNVASAVYGGVCSLMGVAFTLLWLYLGRRRELLKEPMRTQGTSGVLSRTIVGVGVYLATVVVAFVNAYVCLALFAAVALFYVFDFRFSRTR